MGKRIPGIIILTVFYAVFSGSSPDNAKNTYKIVKINDQEWMAENLNAVFFRNGDPIPEASTESEWQKAGKDGTPAWCNYGNSPDNGSRYGRLYNWYAVHDSRGIAPAGFHVASDEEWRRTTDFLGGEDAAGTKMKSGSGWSSDGNGTNESGFSGLPGGCRDLDGKFSSLGKIGFWWSSTQKDDNLAWYRCIDESPYYVYRTNYHKENGLSVRCIRN